MLAYCQLDSWEQISVKFESEFHRFHSRKGIWNYHLPKWRPFCPGGDKWADEWCLTSKLLLYIFSQSAYNTYSSAGQIQFFLKIQIQIHHFQMLLFLYKSNLLLERNPQVWVTSFEADFGKSWLTTKRVLSYFFVPSVVKLGHTENFSSHKGIWLNFWVIHMCSICSIIIDDKYLRSRKDWYWQVWVMSVCLLLCMPCLCLYSGWTGQLTNCLITRYCRS